MTKMYYKKKQYTFFISLHTVSTHKHNLYLTTHTLSPYLDISISQHINTLSPSLFLSISTLSLFLSTDKHILYLSTHIIYFSQFSLHPLSISLHTFSLSLSLSLSILSFPPYTHSLYLSTYTLSFSLHTDKTSIYPLTHYLYLCTVYTLPPLCISFSLSLYTYCISITQILCLSTKIYNKISIT